MQRKWIFLILPMLLLSFILAVKAQSSDQISAISYGESIEFELPSNTQFIDFDFVAEAGDIITVQLEATDAEVDPRVIVKRYLTEDRTSFRRLGDDDDSGGGLNSLIEGLLLEESGSYTISAQTTARVLSMEPIPMRLTLSKVDEAKEQPIRDTQFIGLLDFDQQIEGVIPAEVYGVSYHLNVTAGESIAFEAQFGDLYGALFLRTENGTSIRLENSFAQNVATEPITLPETGRYTLAVSRSGKLSNEVPYSLRATKTEATETMSTVTSEECPQAMLDAYEERNYALVVEYASCVLNRDAANPEALLYRSSAFSQLGRHEEAVVDAQAITAIAPQHADYRFRYGITLYNLERYEEALEEFNRSEELGYNGVHFYRGATYYYLEQYDLALSDLLVTVDASVGTPGIYIWLGRTYLALGDYPLAALTYSRQIAMSKNAGSSDQSIAAAYSNRAWAYQSMRDYTSAEQDALSAIRISPDSATGHIALARVYLSTGQITSALEAVEQVIGLAPDSPEGYSLKADILMINGNTDSAITEYTRALELSEGRFADHVRERIAAIHLNLGDTENARTMLGVFAEENAYAQLLDAAIDAFSGSTPAANEKYQELVAAFNNPAVTPLVSGQPAEIEVASDRLHRFRFEGAAGDTVIATVLTQMPHPDVVLALISPEGSPLAVRDGILDKDPVLADYTLPSNGVYELTIVARGSISGPAVVAITGTRKVADAAVCTALVQNAYRITADACGNASFDEACYGNAQISEIPDSIAFDVTGDITQIATIDALRLGRMDATANEWGVSLMRLRTGLPEQSVELVDMVLFGQVEVGSFGAAAPVADPLDVSTASNINVRTGPSTNDAILTVFAAGQTQQATGRNAAGDWLALQLPDGSTGWVYAPLVNVSGDPLTLPVTDGSPPPTSNEAGIQGFTFRSGTSDRPCAEAPDSGLLIQTPEGVGRISLLINEVIVELGSTAYLTAHPGREMSIYLLEGEGMITAEGRSAPIVAGSVVSVPLGADGLAAGEPVGPQPYTADFGLLPLNLLSLPVTPANPADANAVSVIVPEAGSYDMVWGVDRIACHSFENRSITLRSLQGGRMLHVIGDGYADFYAYLVEPGVYVSNPAATSLFGEAANFDEDLGRPVFSGMTDTDFWNIRMTSATTAEIDITRLRYSPRLGLLSPDTDLDPDYPCDRIENSAVLTFAGG